MIFLNLVIQYFSTCVSNCNELQYHGQKRSFVPSIYLTNHLFHCVHLQHIGSFVMAAFWCRSVLRKVCEGDECCSRPMILCVSRFLTSTPEKVSFIIM